jgi:hypothetical protein
MDCVPGETETLISDDMTEFARASLADQDLGGWPGSALATWSVIQG